MIESSGFKDVKDAPGNGLKASGNTIPVHKRKRAIAEEVLQEEEGLISAEDVREAERIRTRAARLEESRNAVRDRCSGMAVVGARKPSL